MSTDVRYFTSADSRFFAGVAAMLDSLAASGNRGSAFVVDVGLDSDQRQRLSQVAEVLALPDRFQGLHPLFAKLTADLFWSDGVVVFLDSDMVVTSRLDALVEHAAAGKIAVHPDHELTRGRQFPEMVTTFELEAPLRPPGASVNTSPLALSLEHWPGFLDRWRRACDRLPPDWPERGFGPLGLADQDALNAILMSEIPEDAVWVAPDWSTVHADELGAVEIIDAQSLACRHRGETPVVLHYGLSPKAWERSGWRRVRANDAYVRLLRRLLFAADARVCVRPAEVPLWLRPRGTGSVAALLVGLVNYFRVDVRARASRVKKRLQRHRAG